MRDRVEVLGPEVSLDVLRSAISTARVDRLGVSWDERYGQLKYYKERFGHCNVLRGWEENPRLFEWVHIQWAFQDRGQLSLDRKEQLDALGFEITGRVAALRLMHQLPFVKLLASEVTS